MLYLAVPPLTHRVVRLPAPANTGGDSDRQDVAQARHNAGRDTPEGGIEWLW